jgi:aurora kinase
MHVVRAGTLHYMAPEVVKNPLKDHPDDFKNEVRYHYNMVVDSWAVGCLAYELLVGYPPFSANTQQQVVSNINNLEVQYPKRMSEDAIDFIKSALERIPHDRATTTELIKHPWIMQHMVSDVPS